MRFIPDGENVTRVEFRASTSRSPRGATKCAGIFDVEGDWGRLLALFARAAAAQEEQL